MKSVFRKSFIFFAGLSLLLLQSCFAKKLETKNLTIEKSDGSKITVIAELAVTQAEHEKGFMERKNIPDGTGMLFIFENDEVRYFWMKNTPTPLSIAYIDRKGVIRDIHDMTPFSLASVASNCSVRYALEVPKGWFSKNGIKEGDKLDLSF